MRNLKQISFKEAIERVRNGERAYVIDLKTDNKVIVKLFSRMEIGDALNNPDYLYAVVEEVD